MRTRAAPWFGIAVVLAAVAVIALSGTAQAIVAAVAFFLFLGACIRALSLAVRDDDVSAGTIRGPAGRTLGIMGADHAARRRRRRTPRR